MGQLNILTLPYSTRIGTLEILRLQAIAKQGITNVLDPMVTPGLRIAYDDTGTLSTDWQIPPAGVGQRYFNINGGKAIVLDADNNVQGINFSTSQFDSQAIGNGTFKVLLRYATSNQETGTVSVANGSTSVVGTGTLFTQVLAPGRSIIIGSVVSVVQTVTDDTHVTLTAGYGGTTDATANFSVGGMFASNPSTADMALYSYDSYSIVFTSGSPLATDIYLYDVTIASGLLSSATDKRAGVLFSLAPNSGEYTPTAYFGQVLFDNKTGVVKVQLGADGSGSISGIQYNPDYSTELFDRGHAAALSSYSSDGGTLLSQIQAGTTGVTITTSQQGISLTAQTGITLTPGGGVSVVGTGAVLNFPGAGSISVNTSTPTMIFNGVGSVSLKASTATVSLSTAGVFTLSDSTGLSTVLTAQKGSTTVLGTVTINPTGVYNSGDSTTFYNALYLGQYASIVTVNSQAATAGGIVRFAAIGSAPGIQIGVGTTGSLPVPTWASYLAIGPADIAIMAGMVEVSNNIVIGGGGATSSYGGGNGILAIKTTSTPPTSSDATAGLIWAASDGSLKYRSPAGTVTTIGAA